MRLALLLLLAAAPSRAGVRNKLTVLGFSKDGRYFAFQDLRESDSMWAFDSRVEVVDAEVDKRAHAPFAAHQEGEGESGPAVSSETANAAAFAAARPTLEKLGIDLKDRGAPLGADYRVVLSTMEFAGRPGCSGGTVGFKLEVRGPGGDRVLHDEKRVPSSRGEQGCVFGYAIDEVRTKGRYLDVLLDVETIGYEGSDYFHMAVAGRLP